MDAHTAVLVGTLVVLLCVLAFVLWRARSVPARRYEHLDNPAHPRTARTPRRAVVLPVEVREAAERLIAAGRPARAINLILKQTELDIDDAHAAVDSIAARVAKPGQAAWQAAKEADREAARRGDDGPDPGDGPTTAISAGLVGLDRKTQVEIERLLQGGHMDDAIAAVKEATGMTTGQARASLEVIRAQIQRRNAPPRPTRNQPQKPTPKSNGKAAPKPPTRRTPPGGRPSGGNRKR
ncbi:MAG TPA: hypothetical protein VGL93_32080 [Streptosporangiaceae bacterium]